MKIGKLFEQSLSIEPYRGWIHIQASADDRCQRHIAVFPSLIDRMTPAGVSAIPIHIPLGEDARRYPQLVAMRERLIANSAAESIKRALVFPRSVLIDLKPDDIPLPEGIVRVIGQCMLERHEYINDIDVMLLGNLPETYDSIPRVISRNTSE